VAATAGTRLRWYWRRLGVMTAAELAHRVGEQLTLLRLRRGLAADDALVAPPATVDFCRRRTPALPAVELCPTPAPDPEALLAGRLQALGGRWQFTDDAACWHTAPDTGRVWPLGFFGDIDHRAGNPVGDARVMWEPARLQQLLPLARLPGGPACLARQLASFVAANPPWRGIHFVSAMECALRIIAVCHAVDEARVAFPPEHPVWTAVLRLVTSHARLIERRLSLHSSAGNHTIAEAAGLVYAGTLFPELPRAARWRETGHALLAQELDRQVLPDGAGIEQAFCYLRFIVELGTLVRDLEAARGRTGQSALEAAVERGSAFLAAVARADGSLPPVGDADDGCALAPGYRPWWRPARAPAATGTGYSLWREANPEGLAVLFDHGPLGMPPACGHGHADALALLVDAGGRPLLVDPGTGTYTGDIIWRRYFRSTLAHNTVTIDGRDQAVQESPFQWSAPYAATLVSRVQREGALWLLARHDGYRSRGVTHWRGVALREGGTLLVFDHLAGSGRHAAVVRWHVAGEVQRQTDGRYRLETDKVLEIRGAQSVGSTRGDEHAPLGWRSTSYGQRSPIWVLEGHHDGELPCQFITLLHPADRPVPDDVMQDVERFRQWLQ
jgi:hypothetical protein